MGADASFYNGLYGLGDVTVSLVWKLSARKPPVGLALAEPEFLRSTNDKNLDFIRSLRNLHIVKTALKCRAKPLAARRGRGRVVVADIVLTSYRYEPLHAPRSVASAIALTLNQLAGMVPYVQLGALMQGTA